MTHPAATTYIDQGAKWNDIVDGNGTADANGSVNSNAPGFTRSTTPQPIPQAMKQNRWSEQSMWSTMMHQLSPCLETPTSPMKQARNMSMPERTGVIMWMVMVLRMQMVRLIT